MGISYWIYRRYFSDHGRSSAEASAALSKDQHRLAVQCYGAAQKQAALVVQSLLRSLHTAPVSTKYDTSELFAQIRQASEVTQKAEIYELVIATHFRQLVVSIYAAVFAETYIFILMSIAAREKLKLASSGLDSLEEGPAQQGSSAPPGAAALEDVQRFVQLSKRIRLEAFVDRVDALLSEHPISLPSVRTRSVTFDRLVEILSRARDAVEGTVEQMQFNVVLKDFVDTASFQTADGSAPPTNKSWADELQDLVESKDFETVFSACANAAFIQLTNRWKSILPASSVTSVESAPVDASSHGVDMTTVSKQMRQLAQDILTSSSADFVGSMAREDILQRLCSYVFHDV